MRERSAWRWAAWLAAGLSVLPLAAWTRLQVDDRPWSAATIGAVSLLPRSELRARLEHRAKDWGAAMFTVHAGPYLSRSTRAGLGATLDVDEAYAHSVKLGRSGHPLADLGAYLAALRGGLELPWTPRIAKDRLAAALVSIQEQVERPPVPGSYRRDGQLIPGIPGQTVNTVLAATQLEQALRAGRDSVNLAVAVLDPAGPRSYAGSQAAGSHALLYAAETLYPGDRSGRSRNIERAVEAIDGAVIDPGAVFSFNEHVGERSYARGFAAAKELAGRRVVDGVGGGVCQVAATVHAAAFLAGMEITVYQPHSRPVSYIPLGLDTMVSWPDRDLRFQNPYPFPVLVRARATERLVRVELLGAGRPHPVEWSTRVLERIAAGEQRVNDSSLRPGQLRVLQEAIDGVLVERNRTVYWPKGPETTTRKLRYPPTPRLVAQGAPGMKRMGSSRAMASEHWSLR